MADIPVRPKKSGGGSPWLLGLLALAALAVVLFLVFSDDDVDEIDDDDDVEVVDDTLTSRTYDDRPVGPITTLDRLAMADTSRAVGADSMRMRDEVVGQRVDIERARVLSMAGDSAFYVGSTMSQETDMGRRVLVVLDPMGTTSSESDGFDVSQGDTVQIGGTVRAFGDRVRGTSALTAADRERLQRGGIYIASRPNDIRSASTMMTSDTTITR